MVTEQRLTASLISKFGLVTEQVSALDDPFSSGVLMYEPNSVIGIENVLFLPTSSMRPQQSFLSRLALGVDRG